MTYIAKLTKRIMMGRSVALLLALSSLSACGAESALAPTTEAVDEIAMSADSVRLVAGAGIRLSAEVRVPRGRAQDQTVEWQSSDTTIATVDESGLVMTYTEGTTEIRATQRGKTGRTTVVVVAVPVAKVVVTPSSTSIEVGLTAQLVATTLSSTDSVLTGRAIAWATDAPAVATVSSAGIVTAIGAGTARIAATSEGVSGVATFTVSSAQVQPVVPEGATTSFFSDNFDSGSKVSANGFTWSSAGSRVTVSPERAFSGTHALRFRFGPDTVGGDSGAEQRFDMGRYLNEYWVEYMLFVPANFVHRADSPNNNKFFMTWRDTYSDVAGGTWRVGYEYQGTSSSLRPMSSRWDLNSWTSSGLNHPQSNAPFIGGAGPVRLGAWTRVRLQFKAASSRTASDGVMRMWINDSLYASKTDGRFHNYYAEPSDAVLRKGYFLGWSNSGFSAETVFFIDDVRFYDADPRWI